MAARCLTAARALCKFLKMESAVTIKLIALYSRPDDEQAFLKHYHDVHLPLVAQTPHLMKTEVSRVVGAPFGEPKLFMITEMHFPNRGAFDEAMASPENRAAGKDLMSFAKDIVTLVIAE